MDVAGQSDAWIGWEPWPGAAVQTCIVDWPPQWPWNQPTWVNPHAPAMAPVVPLQHTHYHFTPHPTPLSDADVERIARRVAELLRADP